MRLTEAIEALLIATRADGRSSATVATYRKRLKPFLAFFGDVSVDSLTVSEIRRYVAHLRDQTTLWADHPMHEGRAGVLSTHTIAGHVRAFKRLFNWLEGEGEIEVNPTRRIKTPKPKQREPKAIDFQDFLALLETTRGEKLADVRDRAILLFLSDTGCRVKGLCGLRAKDLHFDMHLATVTEKGDQTRLVPVSEMTEAALRSWLDVRPTDQGPWLFVSLGNKATGRLSRNGVRQMLKRRARQAGVSGRVNPHAFRHAFAREFLMSGGDLGTLADLLGHSSVEVTHASYAIFTIKELQEKHRRHSPIARMMRERNENS